MRTEQLEKYYELNNAFYFKTHEKFLPKKIEYLKP